jgi:TolB-like protein/Flp pilus assembly protein TadD
MIIDGSKMTTNDPERQQRRLGAILFADVVGYSFLMGKDEVATHAMTWELIREFEHHIDRFQGEILNVAGDGVLALFGSVVNAVEYAVHIQEILNGRHAKILGEHPVQFRIGINIGDVIPEGGQIYGDGVNIASRLEGLAEPGGVCVSAAVYEQIRNKLNYGYECLGPQVLKNIVEPVEVYLLRPDGGGAVMTASPRSAASSGESAKGDLPSRPSVAVLPLVNMSGDPQEDYFSDGITEDITTSLSKFHDLFVIARGSSFTFKHKSMDVNQVSRALGVRYLVQGSVRQAGKKVRIAVQLVDARSGRNLWADRFDRQLEDIFDLQDEITETIVSAMAVQIEVAERERMRTMRPADLEAYGLVLQGQQKLFHYTREDNSQARDMYMAALNVDARYARAFAAISRTYNFDWRYSWADSPQEALNKALDLARTAVSLDEHDARGYAELGFVNLYRKHHERSIEAYRRSIVLNPNDADVMVEMADALVHAGQSEEAIELMKKAMRLNPFYPDLYLWNLGGAYFNLRQYREAIDTLESMHNPAEGRRLLAASYAHLDRLDEAKFQAVKVLEAHPEFSLKHWEMIQPDKNPDDTAHFVEGLKKAGL